MKKFTLAVGLLTVLSTTAMAAATVVFPVPPLPVTTCSLAMISRVGRGPQHTGIGAR